jgi:hypothetical protein
METPAAHLARLRVQYGDMYRVDRTEQGFQARDRRNGQTIKADTIAQLERELIGKAG